MSFQNPGVRLLLQLYSDPLAKPWARHMSHTAQLPISLIFPQAVL